MALRNWLKSVEEPLAVVRCNTVDMGDRVPARAARGDTARQRLESLVAEQVDTLPDSSIEKLVGRDHVLPYYVSEIISPQVKCGIDRREVALHID